MKKTIVEGLHKPARKKYQRRRVIVNGLDDLWQGDLVEVQPYARFNESNFSCYKCFYKICLS